MMNKKLQMNDDVTGVMSFAPEIIPTFLSLLESMNQ